MSKSDPDPKGCIMLSDEPEVIREKIKKSVTDFTSEVTFDPINRPGVANLITIHSLTSGKTPEEICLQTKSLNTGQYKLQVTEALVEHLNPIREDINRYMAEPGYLAAVIEDGCEKARCVAEKTLTEVKDKVGINAFSVVRQQKLRRKEHVK